MLDLLDIIKKKEEEEAEAVKKMELKKMLEQVKAMPVSKTPRIVKLRYKLNCGYCGDAEFEIERLVSFESSLKDGDVVTKLKPGDLEVGLWKK